VTRSALTGLSEALMRGRGAPGGLVASVNPFTAGRNDRAGPVVAPPMGISGARPRQR